MTQDSLAEEGVTEAIVDGEASKDHVSDGQTSKNNIRLDEIAHEEKVEKFHEFLAADGWEVHFLVLAEYEDSIHFLFSFLTETSIIILLNCIIRRIWRGNFCRHSAAMRAAVEKTVNLEFIGDNGEELGFTDPYTYQHRTPTAKHAEANELEQSMESANDVEAVHQDQPIKSVDLNDHIDANASVPEVIAPVPTFFQLNKCLPLEQIPRGVNRPR